MGRPKKEKPNRSDGRFEIKAVVGYEISGKPIRKSFYSKISKEDAQRQAEQYKIDYAVSLQSGSMFISKQVTFGQWANTWLDTYKKGTVKENTYYLTYKNTVDKYLLPYFGSSFLNNIRPVDIQQFYKNLASKRSQSTADKIQLCLNGIFNTAIENDLCFKNPAKGLHFYSTKPHKEKRTYSEEQARMILDYAKSHPDGISIILLLKMGLRRSELLGLRWKDISFMEKTLSVNQSVTSIKNTSTLGEPKTEKSSRTLPIDNECLNYLISAPKTSDFVIGVDDIFSSVITRFVYKYQRFMLDLSTKFPDIPTLTPHELRHTCGTLLYKKTKNIYAVSKFLGHSNINITTKIYVHNDVDTLRNDLNF